MSSAGEGSGDALDLYELAACGLLTTAADGTIERVNRTMCALVNNALTYGTPDEPVTVTTVVARDALEIRVHNAGRPIPHELQARIFEPMQRGAAQVGPGSRSVGLGLYIVREIASAHGGRVSVRSTEREGTTFTVVLPRAQAAARASQG
ncbi:sensor histidine kinase [Sorangium cellulosum]|uniref:sensor histidine kinase n=1 Tax=Sorangium cellulosum TaxID=56 RepID=UPI003D9A6D43